MITLQSVTLRRGSRAVLDEASVVINPGEKVGLVGRNGAGKSTLFALLDGSLHEDAGEFSRPAHWRLAQVAQEMPSSSESATDFVIGGDLALLAAQESLRLAEADGDGEGLAHAHLALHDAGAHDARARAQTLILGLGFRTTELTQPVDSFSGGWRMRLQLARALMCPSDLLLLDEPTNHLDLDALVWLESWLKRYPGTLLVISHDREFLDAVTSATVHVEQGKLTRYGGNYSAFEDLRAQQIELQQNAYRKQQEKITHLQNFIDRFKAKATKARQAQSRVKALERMERLAPVLTSADFTFEFKEPNNLPNPMLVLNQARFGYPPPAEAPAGTPPTVIVDGVSRSVLPGQRIGILGANGRGKSTLVKTVAGVLAPLGGTLNAGKGLNVGYFAQQELDVLRPDDSPLSHLLRLARDKPAGGQGDREQDLRGFLGSFNFSGDMVKQPVGTMSGGEKARLVLCMIVWQRPNLLLLDEPTNHLDLATREALAVALNEFEGTVLLVSHDRSLLRAVCDEFWLIGPDGLKDFDGDLDDYQRYLLEEARRRRESLKASSRASRLAEQTPVTPPASGKPPVNRKALQRELDQIERRLSELQNEQHLLEAHLSTTRSPDELAETGRRLQSINEEYAAGEDRWLVLSEQLETADRPT
ncbi:MAG TPA: ATP-binding cassette domain-containing protein [Accumulibacter sp.]|nr:ATP-binding cassette domain-containing protein [Accumulibacter sp.]HMW17782.1 ATP-binding cassette domain-containing protein [Accumulibacter sp.]HMY06754.1 ATP-binding cassette domain-containing protein [Accumulibacter sp.]HND80941.1 ATP-binding cassette domain-containing protein [Accumulibacter sp.]HNE13725.1 ATP-binding cassette domain-containing protein [Accumulibacter sp.]